MQESISWGELAELTHKTQVEKFGWCMCEDNEGNENPYADCKKQLVRTCYCDQLDSFDVANGNTCYRCYENNKDNPSFGKETK